MIAKRLAMVTKYQRQIAAQVVLQDAFVHFRLFGLVTVIVLYLHQQCLADVFTTEVKIIEIN